MVEETPLPKRIRAQTRPWNGRGAASGGGLRRQAESGLFQALGDGGQAPPDCPATHSLQRLARRVIAMVDRRLPLACFRHRACRTAKVAGLGIGLTAHLEWTGGKESKD